MSQSLQNTTIGSPGFFGLNTEDSPLGLNINFASVADNAVIDSFGRLGARKGFNLGTADASALSSQNISELHYFEDEAGNEVLFATGNNLIFSVNTSTFALTDVSPGSYTISNDSWRIVDLNGKCYFFQSGQDPLVYADGAGVTLNTDAPVGNIALSAFGRLWVAGVSGGKSVLYWSDLLDGTDFTTGTSGSIDISKVWPNGYDEITAVAAYNDFLVIFGRDNIVVYQGAESPSTMALADTIGGIGCISWRTVQDTGTELLYLSRTGLRSFNRTVQGGALPVSDVSNNIRKELASQLALNDPSAFDSVFYPEEAFYVLTLRNASRLSYCFDIRSALQDGTFRVTRWPGSPFHTMLSHQGILYCANDNGVGTYSGYNDLGYEDTSYRFKFYSVVMTFDQPDKLKFLKQIRTTFISNLATTATVYWGYGFSGIFKSQTISLTQGSISEFGIAEFGEDEFSGGTTFSNPRVKSTGSGSNITVGVEATIDGGSVSLQEINIQTLLGRLQ
jgi:hypothetical protein